MTVLSVTGASVSGHWEPSAPISRSSKDVSRSSKDVSRSSKDVAYSHGRRYNTRIANTRIANTRIANTRMSHTMSDAPPVTRITVVPTSGISETRPRVRYKSDIGAGLYANRQHNYVQESGHVGLRLGSEVNVDTIIELGESDGGNSIAAGDTDILNLTRAHLES